MPNKKILSTQEKAWLITTLNERFDKNMQRHKGIEWKKVLEKIESNPEKLWSLHQMEITGGEPDVVDIGGKKGEIIFVDCSAESPAGRRSYCYDKKAWDARKANKPKNNVMDVATAMGVGILDEDQYRRLQKLGKFDSKTSSWIATPDNIRDLGGAIFADFRYGQVFIYHNGADSYYAARGFRGSLAI